VSFKVRVEIGQVLALTAVLIAMSYWRTHESRVCGQDGLDDQRVYSDGLPAHGIFPTMTAPITSQQIPSAKSPAKASSEPSSSHVSYWSPRCFRPSAVSIQSARAGCRIHGWHWENKGQELVRLKVTTAGFYTGAKMISRGSRQDLEVQVPVIPPKVP
jgi:hypothetical protein